VAPHRVAGILERSKADLRDHGQRLADFGGQYRLVRPSIYADAPATVVHTFKAAA
jgi:hypothetical protein